MASRRNDNGNKPSRSDLLQPLPPEERRATIGPDDVRKLLASIEELKDHQRERAEVDSSNLSRLQETLTGIQEVLTGFRSELVKADGKVGSSVVATLEPFFRNLRVLLEGFNQRQDDQATWLKSLSGNMKDLLDALAKAQGSTISQEALDEWKDAFLEGFEAVLVKAQSRKPSGETRIASTEFEMLTARMESIETGIAELGNEFAESRKGTALVLSRFEEVLDQHGGRVDKLMESNDRLPDSVSRLSTRLERKIDRFRTGWRLLLSPGVILLLAVAVLFESATATVRRLLW